MESATFVEFMQRRGEKARLADALELNRSTITRWLGKTVPAERVLAVERLTGVSRDKIRPDIYPPLAISSVASDLEPSEKNAPSSEAAE